MSNAEVTTDVTADVTDVTVASSTEVDVTVAAAAAAAPAPPAVSSEEKATDEPPTLTSLGPDDLQLHRFLPNVNAVL